MSLCRLKFAEVVPGGGKQHLIFPARGFSCTERRSTCGKLQAVMVEVKRLGFEAEGDVCLHASLSNRHLTPLARDKNTTASKAGTGAAGAPLPFGHRCELLGNLSQPLTSFKNEGKQSHAARWSLSSLLLLAAVGANVASMGVQVCHLPALAHAACENGNGRSRGGGRMALF